MSNPNAEVNLDVVDRERKRRSMLDKTVTPLTAMLLVALLGLVDGSMRAYMRLPTILGEEVTYEEAGTLSSLHDSEMLMTDRHGAGRSLLSAPLGKACVHPWSCQTGLVCRAGTCAICSNDAECQQTNSKNQCQNSSVAGVPMCKHKPLFHPFDHSDVLICLITLVTIMLAAPAGVGGGGILVPMYLSIGKFSPHYGIPLSKATIFGGAVTNNYYNVQRRHPYANRPLVDYNTCMMLEPVLLLGTIIGVFFNAVSPGWLITILLVLSLTYTTYRTSVKALETYNKEEKAVKEEETKHLLGSKAGPEQHPSFMLDANIPEDLREIYEAESRVLTISWIIIAVCSILKGGEGGQGIVACGSLGYWLLVAAPLPMVLGLVMYCGDILVRGYEDKLRLGYEFAEGDIHWTRKNASVYPLYCISAGFAAGALGIAAGTILGPILLELGMLPLVGTASSGFMVIFTASSTTFQFLIMGQLQIDYALFFCGIGLLGGAIGNTVVSFFVKKYKKTWFVVAILSAVLAASTVLMGYAGFERAELSYDHGKNMGIRRLCPLVLKGKQQGQLKVKTAMIHPKKA
ncbi:hypothetical protein GUITHDRAFT_95350 [Guillardia theta CCMP2712]|uniref:Uncharacterized protein n=1 Tax=Guillardia theta (strain CCMP2712) TaxID=905079 RepID=L1J4Y3_GUITC|nr:hypothetical protein GUITHDRAFT_95350 [Guillardia theta CCMP2712]EKX43372.1 hypothetical protein GUITHDRAFT_95350 [Guillardia theta CCMP2712]|eukprot:XP_005830352.1 hypothetical protein GUITHDRAFT_95350 [Guillardia theta CCMP2712]